MRHRSLKNATAPSSPRRVGRSVVTRKVTKAELAVRKEVMRALMSIRGKHIDDVFPPSDRDPSLIPSRRPWPAMPSRSHRSTAEGRKKMGKIPRPAGARRATRPAPHDEDAVREVLLQALMSIRGKHIDDVYPGSSADDEVHA
jgi:hypothetical protein